MGRLFVRISLGILVTLIVASAFGVFVIRAFVGWPDDPHGHSELWGSIRLLQERLDRMPGEKARAELDSLQTSFGFPLAIVPRSDSLPIPFERGRFDNMPMPGPPRFGDRRMLYIPLADDRVLVAGPLPDPPKPSHWLLALVFGGVIIIVGLAGFILAAPVVRRLKALEDSTARFGGGNLGARAQIDSRDAVGSLARRFNAMADGVQKRIEGQKQLLQAVSHELRTPTARIRFGLEMLSEASTDDERARFLASIDDSLTELDQLIGELLDFHRFSAEGIAIQPEFFNVRKALTETADHLSEFGQGIDVKIVQDSPGDLEIYAHPASFKCVIRNLLTNALRYAESEVQIRAYREGDDVLVEVSDDGPGVAESDWERIFEPFFRVDRSRSRESGGVGLGLSIVRQVLQLHNGEVRIGHSPHGGTMFTTRWPDKSGVPHSEPVGR